MASKRIGALYGPYGAHWTLERDEAEFLAGSTRWAMSGLEFPDADKVPWWGRLLVVVGCAGIVFGPRWWQTRQIIAALQHQATQQQAVQQADEFVRKASQPVQPSRNGTAPQTGPVPQPHVPNEREVVGELLQDAGEPVEFRPPEAV